MPISTNNLERITREALLDAHRTSRLPSASIEASAVIQAPIERVWEVLSKLEGYSDWNPFTPQVDGALEVGSDVVLHVQMKAPPAKRLRQVEHVTCVEPGRRVDWGTMMVHPQMLRANRTQQLEALGPDTTRYWTEDLFFGLLVPVVMTFYRAPVQHGFEQVAKGLAEACQ